MRYEFKRDIFFDVEKALTVSETVNQNVIFLLGPRKCGKTVCLRQIEQSYENAKYINFKLLSDNQSQDTFETILQSIRNNESIIYLLDEITYAFMPEREIYALADALTEVEQTRTKVILTGSQSLALESWAHRAFCGTSLMIKADFLHYAEWLRYKKLDISTEQTYQQFLYEVSEFYGFHSLREYLTGCLEETIISNAKTSNYIYGNDCNLVTVDTLLDVCYATLFTLHNHVNTQTFFKSNKMTEDISYYFKEACKEFTEETLQERVTNSFIKSYTHIKSKDIKELKQAFLFLQQCGLITMTPIMDSFDIIPNIHNDLCSENSSLNYKDDLFRTYNFCITYPMFYVRILQDILKEQMPEQLPKALLGSIMECHVRGLLPTTDCMEYHDINHREIDYVHLWDRYAIEMTISNKSNTVIHFDCLPNEYQKVLLTKDILKEEGDILQIPYHHFIYFCSAIKDKSQLLPTIKKHIRDYLSEMQKDKMTDNKTIGESIKISQTIS